MPNSMLYKTLSVRAHAMNFELWTMRGMLLADIATKVWWNEIHGAKCIENVVLVNSFLHKW